MLWPSCVDHSSICEPLAAGLAPDCHRITILPFLSGERAPGWNPSAQVRASKAASTDSEQQAT